MPADNETEDRRKFLISCGKFAAVTPPAMTLLLSTSLTSTAIAHSGSRGQNGGRGNSLFDNDRDTKEKQAGGGSSVDQATKKDSNQSPPTAGRGGGGGGGGEVSGGGTSGKTAGGGSSSGAPGGAGSRYGGGEDDKSRKNGKL